MAELGETTDPVRLVPGAGSSIEGAATTWRGRATIADDAAAEIRLLATPEDWTGSAAVSFENRVESVASRWIRIAEALNAAAIALDEYGSALTSAQSQAAIAIDKWERARQQTADSLSAPLPGSGADNRVTLLSTVDDGGPLRAEAHATLAAARSAVELAGDSAAAAVRAAAEQPELVPEVWAALGDLTTTPREALTTLSELSAADLATLLAMRPDIATQLAQAPPTDVAVWWETELTDEQRDALVRALPAVIGNLGGVSFGARDQANRLWLDGQVEDAEAALAKAEAPLPWWKTSPELAAMRDTGIAEARSNLAALQNIATALEQAGEDGPSRYLISLNADSPPLAAISIGDIDTATNVTYAVPGMGTTTEGMSGWAQAAENVASQQSRLDPNNSHAVVAWIGYETPPVPGAGGFQVLGTEYAEAGAEKLGSALAGFEATRPDAHVNVLAHSYGTTTASIALTQPGTHVDSFVSIGSAGLPAEIDHATDIHATEVFAGQARDVMDIDPADGDQWAWTGRAFGDHPVNPIGPDFGAHAFGTDTNSGTSGAPVRDHSTSAGGGRAGYLDVGTESLRNVALATTGQGSSVTTYVPSPPTPFQQALIDGATNGHGY